MLVVCRTHAFQEGLMFLYEKLRLFREVLQVDSSCLLRASTAFQPCKRDLCVAVPVVGLVDVYRPRAGIVDVYQPRV